VLGVVAFWLGELAAARGHFEAAIAHFRPADRHTHLLRYAQDPEVICLNRLASTLWFLGYPDAARRTCDESLALAKEIGHRATHSLALLVAAMLSMEAREPERLRAFVALLPEYGGSYDQWHTQTHGEILGGYVDVLDGKGVAGIARIRRIIDTAPAVAPTPARDAMHHRVLLAACEMAGEARTGLAAAERMLAMGDAAGLWRAEAHRMRAEFLAALEASEQEVEAEFHRALQTARSHDARSLELRAATSLLGYRLRQGDSPAMRDARDQLATLLDGFSEGRDSHALRLAADLIARS
jgi:hypothetical protein